MFQLNRGRFGKRGIAMILCTGLVLGCLSGCGGRYAGVERGNGVSGSAVSGGAISGSAVSGSAVSGGALAYDSTSVDESQEIFRGGKAGEDYLFCNDTHLYYEDGVLMEHDLSDGSEKEIQIDGFEDVCYVDNKWVYYVRWGKDYGMERASDFCRAPVEKTKLNVKKEEVIFTEKHGMDAGVYCDGRYVLYTAGEGLDSEVFKYDMKEKKYIGKSSPDAGDDADLLLAANKKAAFFEGYEGLYRQDLDSEKMIKVGNTGVANDVLTEVFLTDSDLFYLGSCYDEVSDDFGVNICRYNLKDNKSTELISAEQYRKLLEQKGYMESSYDCGPTVLFVSGDTLYVEFTISWDQLEPVAWCQDKVVLSQKIEGAKDLKVEEGLTKFLKNPKENQKIFEKTFDDEDDVGMDMLYLSRGTCEYVAGEKCFICVYDPELNKNRMAYYDLSSGKYKFITRKDPEWYIPYYNGAPLCWKGCVYSEDIAMSLPNNKEVEWHF